MSAKSIFALAAVCLTTIIVASAFIGLFVYDNFLPHPIQLQIIDQTNPDPNKPNIVASGLTVQDERTIPYSLHVSGRLNNTGGGIAYNASLHVVATNKEGTAIDRFYSFGGITGHMTLGLDFRFEYSGPPIDSCTITAIYTDRMPPSSNDTSG